MIPPGRYLKPSLVHIKQVEGVKSPANIPARLMETSPSPCEPCAMCESCIHSFIHFPTQLPIPTEGAGSPEQSLSFRSQPMGKLSSLPAQPAASGASPPHLGASSHSAHTPWHGAPPPRGRSGACTRRRWPTHTGYCRRGGALPAASAPTCGPPWRVAAGHRYRPRGLPQIGRAHV